MSVEIEVGLENAAKVRPAPQPILRYLETLHGFLDLEEPVPVVGGLRLRRHEPA